MFAIIFICVGFIFSLVKSIDVTKFTGRFSLKYPANNFPYIEVYLDTIDGNVTTIQNAGLLYNSGSNSKYTLNEVSLDGYVWGPSTVPIKIFRSSYIKNFSEINTFKALSKTFIELYANPEKTQKIQFTADRTEEDLIQIDVLNSMEEVYYDIDECLDMFLNNGNYTYNDTSEMTVEIPLKNDELLVSKCYNELSQYNLFFETYLPEHIMYGSIPANWRITDELKFVIPIISQQDKSEISANQLVIGSLFFVKDSKKNYIIRGKYLYLLNSSKASSLCELQQNACEEKYSSVTIEEPILDVNTKTLKFTLDNLCGDCFMYQQGILYGVVESGNFKTYKPIENVSLCSYCSLACKIYPLLCSSCSTNNKKTITITFTDSEMANLKANNYIFNYRIGTLNCNYLELTTIVPKVINEAAINMCGMQQFCEGLFKNIPNIISISGKTSRSGKTMFTIKTGNSNALCSPIPPILTININGEIFTVPIRNTTFTAEFINTFVSNLPYYTTTKVTATFTLSRRVSYSSDYCDITTFTKDFIIQLVL